MKRAEERAVLCVCVCGGVFDCSKEMSDGGRDRMNIFNHLSPVNK